MLAYDAARWHAVLNDLPAALLTVAVLFDLAAAASKRESLLWASIWTLWAGVLGGWIAVVAGELASNSIEHGEAIHEIMEKHEDMALMTMAVFTAVLGWRLIRRLQMPPQELALTRMLSVLGLIGLVWTGVLGGRLMFEHAAGIPTEKLEAEVQNREAGHQHEPGKEHEHGASADSVRDTTNAPAPATHTHPPGTPPHTH